MDLAKNQCNKRLNEIKKNIDGSPDRIRYIRENLQYMIEYIKNIKKQNSNCSTEELNDLLYYKIKEAISSMSSPTRSDMYLYKTSEYLVKNLDLIYDEIESAERRKFIDNKKRFYRYTSDMEKNIKMITQELLSILLENSPSEFKEKFVNKDLNDKENELLKQSIKKFLETFYEGYMKKMKTRYSSKLANIMQLLDEMGLLKKYNNKNNNILGGMSLRMLKYEYEAEKDKFGVTDLKNPEFINRFSLEEIIAMTSFYTNRLVKEVINYNESLYIGNKIGIVKEIFQNGDCELKITDEELREIIVQLEFLSNIGSKITQESANKSNIYYGENKIAPNLIENKVRKQAIETYGEDYNELYKNLFLPQFYNDFEMDLDIATILELDRHNLYLAKDFAIESLMVILVDKGKNKNMNWGYIPEIKDGKNSIQNKEKFVLIGMDMKGYNMPIKLHFERDKLKTFLTNYVKDTKLPVYEGNEDMEIPWNGFMKTQIYMPLTKDQRKQLKETELPKLDYRYRFVEHIKWMMFPNRYPSYLCDHQGKKKTKRYVDITTGRVASEDEPCQ